MGSSRIFGLTDLPIFSRAGHTDNRPSPPKPKVHYSEAGRILPRPASFFRDMIFSAQMICACFLGAMMRKQVEKKLTYDWDGNRARQNRNIKMAAVGALPFLLIGIISLSVGF
jgi:hypothetical protein